MNNKELVENPKETMVSTAIGQSLSGKFKTAIINSDGTTAWEQEDWQNNLILNQGMEAVISYTFANCMNLSCGGTGNRANSFYTNVSSASLSSTTVTLTPSGNPLTGIQDFTGSVASYTQIAQIGDMVRFDDGTEQRITAVNPLTLTVTPGGSAPLQPLTIWKTSQVGLQSLYRYACAGSPGNGTAAGSFWFSGTGYCGTQTGCGLAPNVIGLRRTWDFAYETASVIYQEAGVGWTGNGNVYNPSFANTQVFSRVLLNPTLSLVAGQKMRLIYELDVSILPYTSSTGGFAMTASITNWPVAPATDLGGFYNAQGYYINGIDTNGNTNGYNPLEAAGTALCFISDASAPCSPSGTQANRAGSRPNTYVGVNTVDAYVPMSFTIYKNFLFPTSTTFNPASLRTMGIGAQTGGDPAQANAFIVVFNQNQTKTNTQTLGLSWVWNWGRVLS